MILFLQQLQALVLRPVAGAELTVVAEVVMAVIEVVADKCLKKLMRGLYHDFQKTKHIDFYFVSG